MNTDNLKPARVPGDTISADQHNILVDAAMRTITGPNVVQTPGGWHISDTPGMRDRPVVLVKKPGDTDKTLIIRQIGYVGRKADVGVYEWASKPFEGVPEFGAKVSDYEQFHWAPPDPLPAGITDPVPDVDASFLYARFIKGRWLVLKPESGAAGTFEFRVVRLDRDFVVCHRVTDGVVGTDEIEVALPAMLRKQKDRGGTTFVYQREQPRGSGIMVPLPPGERYSRDLTTFREQREIISDFYVVGDPIWAANDTVRIDRTPEPTLENPQPMPVIDTYEWRDTNEDARRWLAIPIEGNFGERLPPGAVG